MPALTIFLGHVVRPEPAETLLGQILFSPNKCFLHLFKSPQQDRNKQNQTPPHDLSKLWEERVLRPWEKYKATGGLRMSKSYFPSCPQIICFPVFATFNIINNTQQVRSCYVCGSRTRKHILSFSFSTKMQFGVESHETQPPLSFSVSPQLLLCAAPTEVTIYKSTVTGNMGQHSSSTCRSNHPPLR